MNFQYKSQFLFWFGPMLCVIIIIVWILDVIGILKISGNWGMRITMVIYPFLPLLCLPLFIEFQDVIFSDSFIIHILSIILPIPLILLFIIYIFIRGNLQPIRYNKKNPKQQCCNIGLKSACSLAVTSIIVNIVYTVMLTLSIIIFVALVSGSVWALQMIIFLPLLSVFLSPFFATSAFFVLLYIVGLYAITTILGINSILRLNIYMTKKQNPLLYSLLQFFPPSGLVSIVICYCNVHLSTKTLNS